MPLRTARDAPEFECLFVEFSAQYGRVEACGLVFLAAAHRGPFAAGCVCVASENGGVFGARHVALASAHRGPIGAGSVAFTAADRAIFAGNLGFVICATTDPR